MAKELNKRTPDSETSCRHASMGLGGSRDGQLRLSRKRKIGASGVVGTISVKTGNETDEPSLIPNGLSGTVRARRFVSSSTAQRCRQRPVFSWSLFRPKARRRPSCTATCAPKWPTTAVLSAKCPTCQFRSSKYAIKSDTDGLIVDRDIGYVGCVK
jgi:hypothetical protein